MNVRLSYSTLAVGLLTVPLALSEPGQALGRGPIPYPSAHDDSGALAGSIVGTVQVESGPPREPPMMSPYARRRYTPPVRANRLGVAESAAVFVRVGGGSSPSGGATAEIVQSNHTIRPRLTVVRVGTTVAFPNEDDVFHNLFSLSGAGRFNLGRYPPGESRSRVFAAAGVVRMFCDIHSEMEGTILVLDTPYFVRPGPDGSYEIRNVPDGRYTLVAWDAAAGADSTEVVVEDGRSARVDFYLNR